MKKVLVLGVMMLTTMVTLAKALYLYNQAAIARFGA